MKVIFKYTLNADGTPIVMPVGAEALTVREQGENLCLWARVDRDESRTEKRTFQVLGTGHDMPDDPNLRYLGTGMLFGGSLVLHVFESQPFGF